MQRLDHRRVEVGLGDTLLFVYSFDPRELRRWQLYLDVRPFFAPAKGAGA